MLTKQDMSKRALTIGVYDPALIHQASPMCGDNVFAKGLEANGYEVHRLDYRAFPDANIELKRLVDYWLLSGKTFDVIWLGKCERLLPGSVSLLRRSFPTATIIKWAADVRDEPSAHDTELLKAGVDWFFATYAGEYLKRHLFPGMTGVGSIFAFTDSSFYKAEEVAESYASDVLWTGRRGFGNNPIRNEIIDTLSAAVTQQISISKDFRTVDIKMFGHDGKSWLGYPDYNRYINGAKVGIGSNSFNRRKYTSDRLGNYMSCGTFYLTQYIEGIEEVFEKGVHLDWFHTTEEMFEKINYYLAHPEERYAIAKRGRDKVLTHFDYKPLTLNLLQIAQTHEKQNPWEEVFLN